MPENIIEKLKSAKLLGRGGAGFPTGLKWEAVKNAVGEKKYVICNASEGEPSSFKDCFILEKYPGEVVNGIKIAMDEIKADEAYIYLNEKFFPKIENKLREEVKDLPIKIFKKIGNYICGEETTLLNIMEGRYAEPRMKPPYPTQMGLFSRPTLINNVETFYYVSKISKGEYKNTRFYSISGDVKNLGVYELPEDSTTENILEQTNNMPQRDFFIQVGGGACGEIRLMSELGSPICGAGAVVIFDKEKTDPIKLIENWADFFFYGNCDKCVPCREGIYRIREMIKTRKIDKKKLEEILYALEQSSFCPLGRMAATPFKTIFEKVWK
jgi:NADH:ubiquinone oxidoreductase subunit F (NADH-binding)